MTPRAEDYTVGWICAIPTEFVVACELLDEEYGRDKIPRVNTEKDNNSYTFGRIHEHNVVIACLPKGRYGTTSATAVAKDMRWSFPSIRFGLMVGIGGGAPSTKHDVRLGDIVVSSPTASQGGVIQYDFGKAIENHEFVTTGHLAPPPEVLLNALSNLEMQHRRKGHRISEAVRDMLAKNARLKAQHASPGATFDELFETAPDGHEHLVERMERLPEEDNPVVHYGLLASANKLMKDRKARDALIAKHDVLCFEMEAAGLMNNFPCLIIRGICDYSDMHENDDWQGYAAANAAAYAKELLEIIPGKDISPMQTVEEVSRQSGSISFDIPFSLEGIPIAKKFISRPKEMEKLENVLLPGNQSTRRRVFVLRGLGGIGKTQLAVEFMRLHHGKFSAVFWLDGSSDDSVKQNIARQACRIPTDQISQASRTYATTGQGDLDAIIAEVLTWLKLSDNNKWLMVFDNVDREFVATNPDPLSFDIKKYIPSVDHGSILITTRLAKLEKLSQSQEVKKVDNQTARAILDSWHESSYNEIDTEALLERLDGLPLAIAQAGAYLEQKSVSIKTYLRLYDEQKEKVAEALFKQDTLLDDYPNRSIWTTWNISYDAIFATNKHVARLLVLWSFLDRNDLWYGLFERASDVDLIAEALSENFGDVTLEEMSFIDAMSLLRSYSLIEGSEHTEGYMMHTVVQQWVYFYHGTKHRSELGLLALMVTGHAVPMSSERLYAPLQQRLLPHANMCFVRVLAAEESLRTHHSGSVAFESHTSEAEFENCLDAIHMLGVLYYDQGKLAESEKMYMQALQGYEKVLGAEHTSILDTIGNLGNLYSDQGKLAEAERMYLRALQGKEKALGAEHTSTLESVNNLGILYYDQGKLAEAEKMYLRALQGCEKALGADHISTLQTVNGLGALYARQGKLEEAQEMFLRALVGFEKARGADHISTLEAVDNVGSLYRYQGKLAEAERMFSRALAGRGAALGAHHTSTIRTVNGLGRLYFDQGRLDEAEEMYLQALTGYETALGNASVKTYVPALKTMTNLGGLYSKSRPDLARDMYKKALVGYTIVRGDSSDICHKLRKLLDELAAAQQSNTDLLK